MFRWSEYCTTRPPRKLFAISHDIGLAGLSPHSLVPLSHGSAASTVDPWRIRPTLTLTSCRMRFTPLAGPTCSANGLPRRMGSQHCVGGSVGPPLLVRPLVRTLSRTVLRASKLQACSRRKPWSPAFHSLLRTTARSLIADCATARSFNHSSLQSWDIVAPDISISPLFPLSTIPRYYHTNAYVKVSATSKPRRWPGAASRHAADCSELVAVA